MEVLGARLGLDRQPPETSKCLLLQSLGRTNDYNARRRFCHTIARNGITKYVLEIDGRYRSIRLKLKGPSRATYRLLLRLRDRFRNIGSRV